MVDPALVEKVAEHLYASQAVGSRSNAKHYAEEFFAAIEACGAVVIPGPVTEERRCGRCLAHSCYCAIRSTPEVRQCGPWLPVNNEEDDRG